MGEPQFSKGMVVEVCSDDQGLRGAWFIATVLRLPTKKNKVLLEYHTLMVDEVGTRPLREFVNVVNIRPVPPREANRSFNASDEVDAYHNDGWWEGVIIKVLANSRCLVYFRPGKEELEFEQADLRIHREWVYGLWVPPMEGVTEEEAAQMQLKEHSQIDRRRFLNPITEEEHQTISPCLEKSNHHIAQVNGDNLLVTNKPKKTLEYPQSSIGVENSLGDKKGSFPFTKSSHLWEIAESMEAFRLMPQCPHFRPLEKRHEEIREGIAMGHMLNFSNLMVRTRKARLDDPRSMFENKLKALSELEELGFSGQPIRSRLEELLKIKDSYSQLDDRLKTVESELMGKKRQSSETQESIIRLNMQLQALMKEREMKRFKVVELQTRANEIKECIQTVRLDFDSIVAAPWKKKSNLGWC